MCLQRPHTGTRHPAGHRAPGHRAPAAPGGGTPCRVGDTPRTALPRPPAPASASVWLWCVGERAHTALCTVTSSTTPYHEYITSHHRRAPIYGIWARILRLWDVGKIRCQLQILIQRAWEKPPESRAAAQHGFSSIHTLQHARDGCQRLSFQRSACAGPSQRQLSKCDPKCEIRPRPATCEKATVRPRQAKALDGANRGPHAT